MKNLPVLDFINLITFVRVCYQDLLNHYRLFHKFCCLAYLTFTYSCPIELNQTAYQILHILKSQYLVSPLISNSLSIISDFPLFYWAITGQPSF